MPYEAQIKVVLKPQINDPQGKAIADSLHRLGFSTVSQVRAGKYFSLQLVADNQQAANQQVRAICEKLLVNGVVENYSFETQKEGF